MYLASTSPRIFVEKDQHCQTPTNSDQKEREQTETTPRYHQQHRHRLHSISLPNQEDLYDATAMNSSKSASIPITMRRAMSQHQMTEEEAEADYRDFLFYSRVVNGISDSQKHYQNGMLKTVNQECLNNIVKTRYNAEAEDSKNGNEYDDPVEYLNHDDEDEGVFALDL